MTLNHVEVMYGLQQFHWVIQLPRMSTDKGDVFHYRKASIPVEMHLDDFFGGILHRLRTWHKDN